MNVTIYHNPDCGTSRSVLALIRERGIEPTIIEYMKAPPNSERLAELIAATGQPVRALMRDKGSHFHDMGLAEPTWTDKELIDFMAVEPNLIQRPIVVTSKGTKICRPPETVLELLADPGASASDKNPASKAPPQHS